MNDDNPITNPIIKNIKDSISRVLNDNEFTKDVNIAIDRPADMAFGDYSTNIAMILAPKISSASKESKSPLSLAIDLVEKLRALKAESADNMPNISRIEVAGPGFINFYLTDATTRESIVEIIDTAELYGTSRLEAGKKIAFEYTDPNPFKVFHIGHLMSNTVGESLARLAETHGAEVRRFCYQGDEGRHVALTIWGLRLMDIPMPDENASLGEKVGYFGKAYAKGATEYKRLEDDSKAMDKLDENGRPNSTEFKKMDGEVRELGRKIISREDEEVNEIYDKGREWSLQHFEEIYETLGTKFDRYFFESQMVALGKEIVLANTAPKGASVFEESQSAVIFPGEKYGLHTRVFLTKDGAALYEAKEMALAQEKYKAYAYDTGITVTATEQDEYFKVVLKATELLFPEIGKKAKHVSHGMMKLTSGKMSSRTGVVVSGESLIEDMIAQSLEKMSEREMSDDEKKSVSRLVAVAGIKYTVLRQALGKNIIFDPEKSLSFEGDSGPYLQYSYVRAKAVLAKADKEGVALDATVGNVTEGLSEKSAENATGNTSENVADNASQDSIQTNSLSPQTKLEKLLGRYPEIVERAWLELAPHHVANYLIELAGVFNSFYTAVPIVKVGDGESSYKVALTKAFSIVIKNGMNVLGMQAPEKM